MTEAQCRALAIADNQLAISGAAWDEELLRLELTMLRAESFDLNLIGFDDEDLARALVQIGRRGNTWSVRHAVCR